MKELFLVALPVAVSIGAACAVGILSHRIAVLRRRLAGKEADSRVLRCRLDEATTLFEARLSRLEGVRGYAGSRAKQRRHAADLVRLGGDPLSIAKRCELPTVELQMLLQLNELRSRKAPKDLN